MRHGDQARCVVLTPPGAAISEPLRALAAARSWTCVARDDPHLAMAELCLEDRARSTRRRLDPAAAPDLALVLEEAARPGPDLLAAVARYLPDTSIFAHRAGALEALRTPPAGAAPVPPAAPETRRSDPAPPAPPAPEPVACEITPEEIDMLLRTGDDDDAAG